MFETLLKAMKIKIKIFNSNQILISIHYFVYLKSC